MLSAKYRNINKFHNFVWQISFGKGDQEPPSPLILTPFSKNKLPHKLTKTAQIAVSGTQHLLFKFIFTLVSFESEFPANMRRWPNVGLMLAHRLRRWPNSKPTLVQRRMFAGNPHPSISWED